MKLLIIMKVLITGHEKKGFMFGFWSLGSGALGL